MFKVNNKDTSTTSMASFWYLYCKLLTYFTPCSSVSIVNVERAGYITPIMDIFVTSLTLTRIITHFDVTVVRLS